MSEVLKRVKELLNLPQELCNMCGHCCNIATFKGGLSYDEIKKLIANPESDPVQVDGAKDFLAIFEPYASAEEAKAFSPGFYQSVLDLLGSDTNASFFKCKYIGEDKKCKIHEDRPVLCRMYPIPHSRTLFIPGCGFEKQSKKNWAEIEKIIADLEAKK